jgi:hypothetical protein
MGMGREIVGFDEPPPLAFVLWMSQAKEGTPPPPFV